MFFKDFFCFRGFLTIFWRLNEHLLTEHLLITAFTCSWLKCSTVLERKKHSLTVIKDMQMFYPHLRDRNQLLEKYKIKKSIRGVKVKNGNGPVKVFIYYCSTPRSVCIIQHSIHYENRANLF